MIERFHVDPPLLIWLTCLLWFTLHFAHVSGLRDLLLLLTVIASFRRERALLISPPWFAVLAVALWASLAATWSAEPKVAFQIALRDFWFAPLLWYSGYRLSASPRVRQYGGAVLTAALAGLMLVSIFARLPFSDNMPQLAAAYPGPGIASSLALFSVPLLWQYQRMTPVTSAIGGVAILVVAALSYNRMVWLALLCVLVLAELLEKRGRGSRKGVILALVGIVFLGMSISIIARFGSTDEIVKHSSSDPRLAGWQIWLSHAEQRPLYGWGTGKPLLVKTLSATEKMALERVDGDNLLGHGHNMVLNVLLQQGLVGLLLWGWLWGMLLAICWRARSGAGRSWANGGILLLAAALLKGMTDDFMDQSVLYAFWLMLGLMIGSAHQLAREHQE